MKEEVKTTISYEPGYCTINTYFDDYHKYLPTLIVDRNEWDWIETNYIKDGKGWFAKTIGMTHIYQRKLKLMTETQVDPDSGTDNSPAAVVLPQSKRKYVKNKLHKRKKHTKKRKD